MTVTVEPTLQKFFDHISKKQNEYVAKLKEAVGIKSVSSDAAYRPEVFKMGEWMMNEMKRLGISVQPHEPGTHVLDGKELKLPPILMGSYGNDPKKKTVLVYGHYDVQPALKEDGWATDPWTLTEDSQGRMFGRGSTDDKGPIIGWLWVVQAHQELGIDLPVNLKFCFEGMEENGSEGLDELIYKEAKGYFKDADVVCISDNYWLSTKKPCLTYGLRGISYFKINISGPAADLHSGVFGGTLHEPMTDLIHMMSRLVKPNGEILVPGIMDSVAPLTDQEKQLYLGLEVSLTDFTGAIGANNLIYDNVTDTLMHRWRFPSLSLHGIEGAFYAPGSKTVIPAKVSGKFSIRTVPNQTPDEIKTKVVNYLQSEFAKLGSKNKISIEALHGGKSWVADVNHYNYVAGAKAIEKVFKVKPDFTREGGSIPVTLTFQDALQKNVLLLPMGRCDDGAHSINEKLDRLNYIEGIKLLGCYLHEIANVTKS
ncbi:hypothetical protein BKA69DRAFT_1031908 [Paraphysoderma sedebokerense]|nr:hypothetical protein BKA69DRAFT_1031908 [Paraphysoderma sedebokerense]